MKFQFSPFVLPGLERVHTHPSPGAGAMLLPLLLLAIWPGGTEGAALRTVFRNEAQSSEPAQGEVVAHLYSVVDDYLRYYSEETATYKESKKAMTAIIRDALTEECGSSLAWPSAMKSSTDNEAQDSTLVQAAAGGAVAALLFEGASAMECRRGHFQILETFGAQRFVTPHPCITFPPDVHSTCVEREATVRSFKDADAAEDVVDLCHSLYTCCVSASAASGAQGTQAFRADVAPLLQEEVL
eukprot:s3618_g2.t1